MSDIEKPILWYLVGNGEVTRIIGSCDRPKMRYEGGEWTSCSGGKIESEEELRKVCGIPDAPCVECGNILGTRYDIKETLLRDGVCFGCNFWREYIGNAAAIRASGQHYMDAGTNMRNTQWNGFGGQWWEYQRAGEEPKLTNNLFAQGPIPAHFRERLPDNATLRRTRAPK